MVCFVESLLARDTGTITSYSYDEATLIRASVKKGLLLLHARCHNTNHEGKWHFTYIL